MYLFGIYRGSLSCTIFETVKRPCITQNHVGYEQHDFPQAARSQNHVGRGLYNKKSHCSKFFKPLKILYGSNSCSSKPSSSRTCCIPTTKAIYFYYICIYALTHFTKWKCEKDFFPNKEHNYFHTMQKNSCFLLYPSKTILSILKVWLEKLILAIFFPFHI